MSPAHRFRLRVHEALKKRPVTTLQEVAKSTGLTVPTAGASMDLLAGLGIVREVTGKRRNRVFAYGAYLDILNEGTEA